MKKLAFFAAPLATPALAHPAGAAGHLPHWSVLTVILGIGLTMAVYNAFKG